MGMVVRTNMAALGANNALASAQKSQQSGMQKLYTGLKINAAKDDASGLAISEKMKNQIKALDTAKDNCEDGSNMIQTAEGYMKETHDILTRMTELAEKAANGVLKDEDRDALQDEMNQLCGEIDRIATTANFNGNKLLDGSLGSSGKVKVTCTSGKGFEVTSPDENTGKYAGGQVATNASLKDGKTYQVTTADTAGNTTDFKAISGMKVRTVNAAGAVDTTETEIAVTINVQKGDTVTFDSSGAGTSANGLTFSGATKVAGDTFTFDGEGWMNAEGHKLVSTDGSSLTMKLDSAANTAGEKFEYDEVAAKHPSEKNAGINLQIGESSTSADRLNISINSFKSDSLFKGLDGLVNTTNDGTDKKATAAVKIVSNTDVSTYSDAVSIDITDKDAASAAADAIRQISNYVSDERGKLGAQQNRLDHTINNLTTTSENTTAAKSRILDTDMAKEMMEYTSKNVIAQAAQSMLAQANSQPQNVLSLLQ